MPHKLQIVGAGCGDAELLTIKAHRLITNWAEVVLYDRLVSADIINLIPDNVEKIFAGKSCKQHYMTQDEINAAMVKYHQMGKKVVRLKGGDPFIFGRGGEEIEFLAKHNIECDVVAGISAAAGAAASLSIPLTYRNIATSVIYMTGHKIDGQFPNVDWLSLAENNTTLVIYMGLGNIQQVVSKLVERGVAADTPSVAIHNATLPDEKSVKAKLAELPKAVVDLSSPVVIIVGKVVG